MPTSRLLPLGLLLIALAGCTPPKPSQTPPKGVDKLLVAPPENKTGQTLIIDEPGAIGRVLQLKRVTVPNVLASELRRQLEIQGFAIVPSKSTGFPTLKTEIRRWELYPADYSQVTVDITATLVDGDGREIWRMDRKDWRVPTSQSENATDSSRDASATIAEHLVLAWRPSNQPAKADPDAPEESDEEY
jgi:hypothetical protein